MTNTTAPILFALANGLLLVVSSSWLLLKKLPPQENTYSKILGWCGLLAGAGLLLMCLG